MDILLEQEDYILTRYKNIFKKNNILTVNDLMMEFPTRYENFVLSDINKVEAEETVVIEGSIASKITTVFIKTKLSALNFLLDVDGKMIRCTIFNRTFLKNKLDYGIVIKASGKFNKSFNNFTIADIVLVDEIDKDILPVYKIKDISEAKYIEIMDKVLRRYKRCIKETLPLKYLEKYQLLNLPDTVKIMHQPESMEDIEKAKQRLKYEELLNYNVSMKYLHHMREKTYNSPIINPDLSVLDELKKILPYELTNDQLEAINDIYNDLKAPYVMNRLLQGEVGSGKTIVSFAAMLMVVKSGFQAALMCPTEILSHQHFDSLNSLLENYHIPMRVGILTGSTPVKQRKQTLEELKEGLIDIIIGTHALFQKDVEYKNLGIVIADEEHRFGVRQRVLIRNKGEDVNYLKMSATPIPRTLSISAYGDMDISVIKEMPKNRKKVITKYITNKEKKDVIKHILKEIAAGHQIYVVTPLINESESLDTANATEIYQNMKKYFAGKAEVGMIHGRLSSEEKEQIMEDFLTKKIDILVATSVIEVGVNIINATTILILGAERFGVATLHQLRGRVMRSSSQPYCFLMSEHATEAVDKRLKMLENTTDGFELAEYDLLNRGPGEFFGEKQSGSMNFKYADLRVDGDLLNQTNMDAIEIVESDDFYNNSEYATLKDNAVKNYERKLNEID